jgi:hypothetical protein
MPTFQSDIKPLFRARDRSAMRFAFDLWSSTDVQRNATKILSAVRTGAMPCDGKWPPDQVALFQAWVDAGMPD